MESGRGPRTRHASSGGGAWAQGTCGTGSRTGAPGDGGRGGTTRQAITEGVRGARYPKYLRTGVRQSRSTCRARSHIARWRSTGTTGSYSQRKHGQHPSCVRTSRTDICCATSTSCSQATGGARASQTGCRGRSRSRDFAPARSEGARAEAQRSVEVLDECLVVADRGRSCDRAASGGRDERQRTMDGLLPTVDRRVALQNGVQCIAVRGAV